MAWFGKYSAAYRRVFDAIFSPEWMHWVMHAFLYAGLAMFVMMAFDLPVSKRSLGMILAITLVVGGLQESWQIISGVQILGWNTLFDLGMDTLGGIIGFCIFSAVYLRSFHRSAVER